MKRFLCLLAVVAILASCSKIIPTKEVNIDFFESGVTVTFTNGSNTYVFDEEHTTHLLPLGKYQICADWNGGCGGLRMTKDTPNGEEQVLLIMPAGGTECVDNQRPASQYYVSVNCE
jgi:hypothetical protein